MKIVAALVSLVLIAAVIVFSAAFAAEEIVREPEPVGAPTEAPSASEALAANARMLGAYAAEHGIAAVAQKLDDGGLLNTANTRIVRSGPAVEVCRSDDRGTLWSCYRDGEIGYRTGPTLAAARAAPAVRFLI